MNCGVNLRIFLLISSWRSLSPDIKRCVKMKKLNETYLKGMLKFDCDSTSNWSGTEKSRERTHAQVPKHQSLNFAKHQKRKNPNGMGE